MLMNQFKWNDYYTLRDLLDKYPVGLYENAYFFGERVQNSIKLLITNILGISTNIPTYITDADSEILYSMMIQRYEDWFIYSLPHGTENTSIRDEDKEFVRLFVLKLKDTFPVYKALISHFEDENIDLMGRLGSSSKTRYNDTPQDGGDFSDDEHTSSITEYDYQYDPYTIMQRLEEIRTNLVNIRSQWVDEFSDLFIPNYE